MKTQTSGTGTIKQKDKPSFPYGYIILGLLASCIGACFLTLNNVYTYLAIAMGAVMIIFSLVPFANAFTNKKRGVLFVLKIIASISGIAAGIVTLIVQSGAINVIANVLYLAMIIDGAYKVGAAIHSHKFYLIRFWTIVIFGSVIVVSAFLISKFEINPSDNSNTIHAILTGALLILDGLMNILYAFFRGSFLIPDEFIPENKRRIDDTTPEPKCDTSTTDAGTDPHRETSNDTGSDKPEKTPQTQKTEDDIPPFVVKPIDFSSIK